MAAKEREKKIARYETEHTEHLRLLTQIWAKINSEYTQYLRGIRWLCVRNTKLP